MPLYLYRCTCGRECEALRKVGTDSIACACGGEAQRDSVYLIGASIGGGADWKPVARDGGRVRTPLAERQVSLRQYREATEEIAYTHRKAEDAAQMNLPQAPLMELAKAKVARLQRAGVTDSLDIPKG